MTDLACVKCHHGWAYHHAYDDELGRYVPQPCDHWQGCGCEAFMPAPDEDRTCGCGLYISPSRRNPKAIHIADCPWCPASEAVK